MYSLKLLGGASLESDGVPVAGTAAQRRRLALLALLARVPGGLSRERLAAYLFPDADEGRAHRAISDALYAVRKTLGKDAIVAAGDEIRLDPAALASDAGAFEAAIAAGELGRAAALYRGPFLDGFFVTDAPEFERWADGERQRLARKYGEVLETLARRCEAAGDLMGQVEWFRQLAAHDPLNPRVAARLMLALEAAGDSPGALRHARVHQSLLREELGVGPSAEIAAIIARLTSPAKAGSARADAGARAPAAQTQLPAAAPSPAIPPPAEASPLPVAPSAAASPLPVPPSADIPVAAGAKPPSTGGGAGRRPRRMIAVFAAGLLAILALVPLTTRAKGRTTIAILPFENLSAGGPHSYIAGGLRHEIETQLTKVAALEVVSPASTMQSMPSDAPPLQLGRDLGVRRLVAGSVQVDGVRLRVNVRLLDAASGAHLWAERYDRTLEDAFEVQSDVARQIVAAVGARLTEDERRGMAKAPTTNAQAYHLYLQGWDYFRRPGGFRQNWQAAQALLERAVAADSGFALARAALSQVHGHMYWWAHDPTPARLALQLEQAEAALRLAPDLPQAHLAIGLAHYYGRRDFRRALSELEVALRGLPNDADLVTTIGAVHRRLGNWEQAIAAYQRAVRLDPRSARAFNSLGQTYQTTRWHAEAIRAYDQALELAPDLHGTAVNRAWVFFHWRGTLDTLRAVLARMPDGAELALGGSRVSLHANLLHLTRQPDSVLLVLSQARTPVFEGQVAFLPASLYAAWAHRQRGDSLAAAASFSSAHALLDSVARERPDDRRVHFSLGLALAGLGRTTEARREAEWLRQTAVYRDDAYEGALDALRRAQILAQIGDAEGSIDEVERLLVRPSTLSVHMLRLDPLWDPIREHPRFRAVVAGARR